jgi:hypothetical protein
MKERGRGAGLNSSRSRPSREMTLSYRLITLRG